MSDSETWFGFIIGLVLGWIVTFVICSGIGAANVKAVYEEGIKMGVAEKYIDGDVIKYRFIRK